MKRGYQYLMLTGFTGLLCLFLSVSANAQRGGGHSGGGGGRSGGGQSFSRGGGGGGFSGGGRSSGGFSGGGQSFSRGNSGGGRSYGGGQVSGGFSRGQSSGTFSRGRTTNSYNGGSFSRGRTTNGLSSAQSFQRGSAYSRGGSNGSSPSFRRVNPGYSSAYRGSIRGGFSRGGRYYAGGYGRPYSYGGSSYRYSPWATRGGYYYNRGFYSSAYYPRLGFSLGVLPYGYYPFYWGNDRFFYSGGYFYQYDNNQYTVVEPPIGAAVNSLPSNAQAITINGQQFYELNGVYYTPITKDDGTVAYQVAGKDGKLDTYSSPENGYAPENDGYVGRQDNGGAVNQDNGAVNAQPMDDVDTDIAMPEIGDLFYSLPTDSRKIKIQGQNYFVSPDDYYYQETRDQKGNKAYKVMGTPDNAPGN
jgi:hypothetical protein